MPLQHFFFFHNGFVQHENGLRLFDITSTTLSIDPPMYQTVLCERFHHGNTVKTTWSSFLNTLDQTNKNTNDNNNNTTMHTHTHPQSQSQCVSIYVIWTLPLLIIVILWSIFCFSYHLLCCYMSTSCIYSSIYYSWCPFFFLLSLPILLCHFNCVCVFGLVGGMYVLWHIKSMFRIDIDHWYQLQMIFDAKTIGWICDGKIIYQN